jgi:hypothetical protein
MLGTSFLRLRVTLQLLQLVSLPHLLSGAQRLVADI